MPKIFFINWNLLFSRFAEGILERIPEAGGTQDDLLEAEGTQKDAAAAAVRSDVPDHLHSSWQQPGSWNTHPVKGERKKNLAFLAGHSSQGLQSSITS